MATAFAHTRPGGVALFVPDCTRETFATGTDHGGHDGTDGRALRYVEWTTDPDPSDTTYEVDFAVVLHEPGRDARVVHDRHVLGSSPSTPGSTCSRRAGFSAQVDPGAAGPTDEAAADLPGLRPA